MSENKKEATKGGNSLIMIIILVLLILILAGGGAGGYFLWTKMKAPSTTATSTTQTVTKPAEDANYPTEEYLINLADENSNRYLKIKLVFTYDKKNKKLATEITDSTHIISDAIISYFKDKKAAEFTSKGDEDMKKALVKRVNADLTKGTLSNVYFTELLVQ